MDNMNNVIRLVPTRTYVPKSDVDFAGPSYFAGPNDEFIMVPTKSGDILFWDRESGVRNILITSKLILILLRSFYMLYEIRMSETVI